MRIAIFSLASLAMVIVAVVLCFAFIRGREAERRDAPEKGVRDQSGTGGEDQKEDVPENLAGVTGYEPPEYDFRLDEITVEIPVDAGAPDREYEIAFINDLHLITDSEPGDVAEEFLPTVRERYDSLAVTPEGVHSEDLWPEVVKFLNYHDFDAVILGGDILDYCSHSNIETLMEGIDALKYPKEKILYLRSDHDYGGWYGGSSFTDTDGFIAQAELWDGDQGKGWIEFDEFIVVGINKSYQNIADDKLEFLMEKLDEGKPVIVATHVPFYSETDGSLAESSQQMLNGIYYWNQEETPYCTNQNTQAFIDRMYGEDSNVVQILAAHLHVLWDGYAAGDVKEHLFAPTYEGRIGIIYVTTVKDEK